MRRRCLSLTLLAFLALQPAHGQQWMGRYLNERKSREEEDARKQAEARRAAERDIKRREAARNATPAPVTKIEPKTEATPPPAGPPTAVSEAPATRLSDTIAQTAAQTGEPEVRRAIPLEPFITETEAPTRAPAAPAPVAPAVEAVENVEHLEIRRAEAVTPPQKDPVPVETAPPTETAAAPAPVPVTATPPTATAPVESAPAAAATTASTPTTPPAPATTTATTAATEATEDAPKSETPAEAIPAELDPGADEIRLTPGAATVPADVAQFILATRLYAKKEYRAAIPEFERYLTMAPNGADRPAAFFRLAESYRITGSFNAARQNYEALIYTVQIGAFIGPASYRLAEICYNEKDYAGAVSFFRKASVWIQDPAIALSAKFYSARSLENLKFSSDAIRAYEDVITTNLGESRENPYREASQVALVNLLTETGRKLQAIALLNTLRQESPKPAIKAEATVRMGLLLLDQKQSEKAEREFKAALQMPELGSWREVAETGLLRLLYSTGKYQQVVDLYKASPKEFSPAVLPEVLLIVGNAHRQLGKNDTARKMYDQIMQDAPNSNYAKDAGYERLVALYSTDSPDLITEIDAYLARNPEANARHDQLTLMKAESLYKTKQYEAAAPLYAALKKSSLAAGLRGEAMFKLGWCNAQTGAHEAAISAFSEFLKAHPAHKMAATALAQRAFCYEQSNNYQGALADFNEVIQRYPKAKEREFSLQRKALILGQQDESKAMVDTFTQLLKEFPKSQAAGQANYWIGLTAFQAKNYKEAVAPLKAARSLDKEFSDRATALVLACEFYLENRDTLAAEVDKADAKVKVPSEILRWLGTEYIKMGDATHAERYLAKLTARVGDEAEEIAPSDWLDLCQARLKLQQWKPAKEAIQTYLKKVEGPLPKANGTLALGQAELGAGNFEGAQEAANMTQQLQPEGRLNALGRLLSGDIAMAQSRFDEAAKLYMSVSVVFDDPVITPQSLEKAYTAYQKLGDEKLAAKTLNTLKSRFPEYKLTVPAAATTSR